MAQTRAARDDKRCVGRFLEDAQNLFQAAESAAGCGQVLSNMTILVGQGGGIHMVADSDWPLDRLAAHHGAREAFRVCERNGRVSLEGREGARACRIETPSPRQVARQLLNATPALLPLETVRILPAA